MPISCLTRKALTYLSYHDPNLLETLDIYDQTPGFLKRAELDKTELTCSIIGTIGEIDAYQLPDAKGFSSETTRLTHLGYSPAQSVAT